MSSYLAEIESRLKRVEQIVAVSAVELNRTESMNNFIHIIIREKKKKRIAGCEILTILSLRCFNFFFYHSIYFFFFIF